MQGCDMNAIIAAVIHVRFDLLMVSFAVGVDIGILFDLDL